MVRDGEGRRVEIAEPDSDWPARFEVERARLAPLLPGMTIHHVGSTAVPGLIAKPIIDLMVLVPDLDAPIDVLVTRGGYYFPEAFNAGLSGRRYLTRPSEQVRTHNLHLVGEQAMLDRYLAFRDRLRANPELRAEYAALKRDLAIRFADDRDGYTAAKAPFVARVEALGPLR